VVYAMNRKPSKEHIAKYPNQKNRPMGDQSLHPWTPAEEESKRLPFEEAAPGAVALETILPAAMRLYHAGHIDLPTLFRALSLNPARRLGLPQGRMAAGAPADLVQAMRYAVLDGGKRLRPLLVLGACESVQGNAAAALRAACAVELIHAYSLVHDDMPCMDNDVLRRGKPTVHVQFGEASALLAGDALQALAFELLTPEDGDIAPAVQARLCRLLARAAGSAGMAVPDDGRVEPVAHVFEVALECRA
jgi:hypothetical protein